MTTTTKTFSDYGLKQEILSALEDVGFSSPTPIQAQTLPHLLGGRDVMGQASTGSGKTGAFVMPMLQHIDYQKRWQGLVVVPTRELATQVNDEIQKMGAHLTVRTAVITGGKAYGPQVRDLKSAHIVVATPGRLKDLLNGGALKKDFAPTYVVLDEADRMLDMGFIDDIREIFTRLPEERQTVLFSATFPEAVENLIGPFMRNPQVIKIKQETRTNSDVSLLYSVVRNEEERNAGLLRILETADYQKAILFVQTKRGADELGAFLRDRNLENIVLHGDTPQHERELAIQYFKEAPRAILVATDLAARGLDVPHVDLVINFNLPYDGDTFVHRIGRTGRAGKKGTAKVLVLPHEVRTLKRIEKFIRSKIQFEVIPAFREVEKKFSSRLQARVAEVPAHPLAEQQMQQFLSSYGAEELIISLLSLQLQNLKRQGPEQIGFQRPPLEDGGHGGGSQGIRPREGGGHGRRYGGGHGHSSHGGHGGGGRSFNHHRSPRSSGGGSIRARS